MGLDDNPSWPAFCELQSFTFLTLFHVIEEVFTIEANAIKYQMSIKVNIITDINVKIANRHAISSNGSPISAPQLIMILTISSYLQL